MVVNSTVKRLLVSTKMSAMAVLWVREYHVLRGERLLHSSSLTSLPVIDNVLPAHGKYMTVHLGLLLNDCFHITQIYFRI
jgi:hypothetical protein